MLFLLFSCFIHFITSPISFILLLHSTSSYKCLLLPSFCHCLIKAIASILQFMRFLLSLLTFLLLPLILYWVKAVIRKHINNSRRLHTCKLQVPECNNYVEFPYCSFRTLQSNFHDFF